MLLRNWNVLTITRKSYCFTRFRFPVILGSLAATQKVARMETVPFVEKDSLGFRVEGFLRFRIWVAGHAGLAFTVFRLVHQ